MLLSENLVFNGGFAAMQSGTVDGWQVLGNSAPQRVATEKHDTVCGFPLSAFAMRLASKDRTFLTQRLSAPACEDSGIVRITARATEATAAIRVSAKTCSDADPDTTNIIEAECEESVLASTVCELGPRWYRHRIQVPLPRDGGAIRLGLESVRGQADVTDIRFAIVQADTKPIAIRFETRGSIDLPSTRLRALMFEDYLNLAGWPVHVNAGSKHDLLVCQKVIRWRYLVYAKLKGGRVVFDLDDNELTGRPLRAAMIRLFSWLSDGVTAGGSVLVERMSRINKNAYLLDNPVDTLDPTIKRPNRGWDNRLVWFGMPENRWMLDSLDLGDPVTAVTRDGDIDYAPRSVDAVLTDYDLALLPVVLTPHTRAKNANRLIKCVGLGLPFLASDTPEHRRALDALALSSRFLVREDWPRAIADIAADYAAARAEIDAARARAFAVYGVGPVMERWLDYCRGLGRDTR